jgi:assimilatory nitrate reductase catalytic subunit
LHADGRLLSVRLVGETLGPDLVEAVRWPRTNSDASLIRFALAPHRQSAPVTMAPRNIVCKCADVSDVQIRQGTGCRRRSAAIAEQA